MRATQAPTRRTFLQAAGTLSAAALLSPGIPVFAAGSDRIRVGLVGCGGRGTGAAQDCLNADPGVEITALADLFEDRLQGCRTHLGNQVGDRLKVTDDTCFVGFDACEKLCALDTVDLVIIATPPHFRPQHVEAIVEAGKHAFVEKPAGVDPVGLRRVMAAADRAREKGLAIVAGTQRRHSAHYIEIMKRIHGGDIGEIVGAQAYWNGGDMLGYWKWWERDGLDDMTWQCRSWPWFTWTSGDHMVEQHVHNLDIVQWALQANPEEAMGTGGRAVRTLGNIWDHFAINYRYPNGVQVNSQCRQINGCSDRVSELILGSKGQAYLDGGTGFITGPKAYKWDRNETNPYVQEHKDLIASIRAGTPLNELRRVAESTLVAVMGRCSAYSGRALSWNWLLHKSTLDLAPPAYAFGPCPPDPVAVPGQTPLV